MVQVANEPEIGELSWIKPHPLLVDHIIESIFDSLSIEKISQLLSLRLVCKHWHYYATKVLRKKYFLSFGGHKYNIGRLKCFLDEYSVLNKNNSFPIKKFRLFSDLFQQLQKPTIIKFLSHCAPNVESLVIFKDINSDIEYTQKELLSFNFPNLKEFSLSDRRKRSSELLDDDANCSFLHQVISSASQSLTSLSIKYPREPIYEIYEKEDLVLKVFEHYTLPKLRVLKLDMSITDKILKVLTAADLKSLKSLHLSLGASQFSSSSLKALLISLAPSLEELRLTDLYRRASLTIDLPLLENLKKFEIHGLELPAYFVTFPEFNYQGRMPNLKKLALNTFAPIKSWEVFVPECDEKELPALSKSVCAICELSLAMNFDCPVLMKRLSNIFTGVRVLEMHFSRSHVLALKSIFMDMGQLEELKLNQSYLGEISTNCIDDVLTGLSLDECKRVLKKKAYYSSRFLELNKNPNLANLKNLKKFDMFGLRHRNAITDVTAYLVFLKMENLCILEVGKSEISDICLRDLATRFPNGKFKKYLNKKYKMNGSDSSSYKNSVLTSICAVQ